MNFTSPGKINLSPGNLFLKKVMKPAVRIMVNMLLQPWVNHMSVTYSSKAHLSCVGNHINVSTIYDLNYQ